MNYKVKMGYWLGNNKYIPEKLRYCLENLWYQHIVYNFPLKVISQDIIELKWRKVNFKLKIRKHKKYSRDPYPFTLNPLGELIGPLPGYLRYYSPSKGDIIIDAGSYPGIFAVWLAKQIGENGRVYCFEPDFFNAEWCKNNLKVNNISNVEVITKGLGNQTKGNFIRLDDFVEDKQIRKIDFIKWSIEGCEIKAMSGSKKSFTNYSPQVAIASFYIVDGRQTYVRIGKMLKNLGYKVKTDCSQHLTTYAWKGN